MNKQFYRDQISAYLEGNLNEVQKSEFENYKNSNQSFSQEVDSINNLMIDLNNLESTKTQQNFISNLNNRIDSIDSSLWSRVFNVDFFTSNYLSIARVAAAFLIVISSSYILINQSFNMNLNFNNYTNKQNNDIDIPSITDNELTTDSTSINTDIRLVGRQDN